MTSMISALVLMATLEGGALQGQLEAVLERAEKLVRAGESGQLEQVMSPAMAEMWQQIMAARKAKTGKEKEFSTLLHNWFSADRPLVRVVEKGEQAGLLYREKMKLKDEPVVNYTLLRFLRVAGSWRFTGMQFQVGNTDHGFDWAKYPELVDGEAAEPPADLSARPAAKTSDATRPEPPAKTAAQRSVAKVSPVELGARCESACTLLLHYPFDELEKRACQICRPVTDDFCEVDFPFNDVPECTAWDELRNCIYARYGRPFKTPEWRKAFEKAPWYKADPTYTDDRLSPAAKANIRRMIEFKKNRYHCQ